MIPVFRAQKMMRLVLMLILAGVPFFAHADCQVTMAWDANNPAPEGYRLYGREEGQPYDYSDFLWQGDHTFHQCTIPDLDEHKTYYFVVRAYEGDDLSGDSNEVRFNSDDNSLNFSDSNKASSSEFETGCFIQSLFH